MNNVLLLLPGLGWGWVKRQNSSKMDAYVHSDSRMDEFDVVGHRPESSMLCLHFIFYEQNAEYQSYKLENYI